MNLHCIILVKHSKCSKQCSEEEEKVKRELLGSKAFTVTPVSDCDMHWTTIISFVFINPCLTKQTNG